MFGELRLVKRLCMNLLHLQTSTDLHRFIRDCFHGDPVLFLPAPLLIYEVGREGRFPKRHYFLLRQEWGIGCTGEMHQKQ